MQSENALLPIEVTPFGNVIDVNAWQFKNAPAPIVVRVSGNFIVSKAVHPWNAPKFQALPTTPKIPVTCVCDKSISFSLVQPENVFVPIDVKVGGNFTVSKDVHP
jgi:hypothetical protein